MSESLKSFFILLGGLLLVLALWYLSVLAVRHDTRRRVMRGELRLSARRVWVAAAVGLPLFGFALYLFQRILSRYLTPPPEPDEGEGLGVGGYQTEARSQAGTPGGPVAQRRVGGGDTFPVRPAAVNLPPGMITHTGGNGAHGSATNGARHYQTPATLRGTYQPPRARFDLVALEGPYAGQVFQLESLPLRIGRGPGAALALDNDLNISRRHAEIYEWNGTLRVHDLGSTYGTLINGIPVTDQALAPGDHLALGGTVLMLRELP